MRAGVDVVLICEDRQHEFFARRLLTQSLSGLHRRGIRTTPLSAGTGDAKRSVRERLAKELRAFRARPGENRMIVVMTDADNLSTAARRQSLHDACRAGGDDLLGQETRAFVFIPKWEIETWLEYLKGEPWTEDRPPRLALGRESQARELVDRLVEMCRAGELRAPAPASLVEACREYARMRQRR